MSIALQIERAAAGTVAAGENVIFDNVAHISGDISYNGITGTITFNAAGSYLVNWWVATQASTSVNGAIFALYTSESQLMTGNSPVKKGEVYGTGIVTVSAAPVTASLINQSTDAFYYAQSLPLTATLVITKADAGSADTMACFAVKQMTNILSQMLTAYPDSSWTIFSNMLTASTGVPVGLYASPETGEPAILQIMAGTDYGAIPIASIMVVYVASPAVYDPSFTFLPLPDPLPPGCNTDLITVFPSYLPLGTSVSIGMSPNATATGMVYKNEYGVLVLSDTDGNTPMFIATPYIRRIITTGSPVLRLSSDGAGIKLGISTEVFGSDVTADIEF